MNTSLYCYAKYFKDLHISQGSRANFFKSVVHSVWWLCAKTAGEGISERILTVGRLWYSHETGYIQYSLLLDHLVQTGSYQNQMPHESQTVAKIKHKRDVRGYCVGITRWTLPIQKWDDGDIPRWSPHDFSWICLASISACDRRKAYDFTALHSISQAERSALKFKDISQHVKNS